MLLNIGRRSARRSVQRVRNRKIHSNKKVDNTIGSLGFQREPPTQNAWRVIAVAATLGVVAASHNDKPAHNQSTKRYSRNIRASYDLLEKTVGTGGFGHVVAGVHRETGEHVAVKFINKKACPKDRVTSEVELLRIAGEHANIISFYGFYEDERNYYLVMEMARGGELFDQLVQYGAYSESQARTVIKAIVDGLSYLHQQRIVHLDLKPENIMLTVPVNRAGGKDAENARTIDVGSIIRLVDFGSASRLDNKTGVVKFGSGTVAYSPPELLNGKPASDKADIWALGIILFILLRGFHPFDPFNDADDDVVQERIIKNEYLLHALTWEGLSKPAKDLIMQMLDPNPENRPTALEMLSHEWLLSDGLSTEPLEETAENLRRYHRGRRRLKAMLLAVMADLLPTSVHRRTKSLGSRRSAIRWVDYDNKEFVTAQDLRRACRLLDEGSTQQDQQELAMSIRRRQTATIDPDTQEMLLAAQGTGGRLHKVVSYQDLIHLLPPLCPGRKVQQGEYVYNIGDEDGQFYLLKEGTVSLKVPASNGGKKKEVDQPPLLNAVDVSRNDHFGQLELLETVADNRVRNHAAQCTSQQCEIYEVLPAEFSLLTDVFSPVANRLTTKAESIAQLLARVHLKSAKEYKMVVLDHPTAAADLVRQTFPGEPVILFLVDGSMDLHESSSGNHTFFGPGRFIALPDERKPLDLNAECPSLLEPKANDMLAPTNGDNVADAMLLAVPLRHARDILQSPGLHAIRQNLPS